MNAQSLPMTSALSTLAAEQGVDISGFAAAEQIFNEMFAALIARDDEAFDRASKRFDEATKERSK